MNRVPKETAERVIFNRFRKPYENLIGDELSNIIYQDMPDFLATIPTTGELIGIEVTGVYQDEEEAKIQYWRVDKWGKYTGDQKKIIAEMNRILASKAQKSREYDFDGRLLLVLFLGSLVFNEAIDMKYMRPYLNIPDNGYSEIWVIVRDRNDSYDLFPLQSQRPIG